MKRPVAPQNMFFSLQDRRGRSLDIQEGHQGQKDNKPGSTPSMFRRHTDPAQQPQVQQASLF